MSIPWIPNFYKLLFAILWTVVPGYMAFLSIRAYLNTENESKVIFTTLIIGLFILNFKTDIFLMYTVQKVFINKGLL